MERHLLEHEQHGGKSLLNPPGFPRTSRKLPHANRSAIHLGIYRKRHLPRESHLHTTPTPKFVRSRTKIPENIIPIQQKCNPNTRVIHMEGFSVRDNLLAKILHIFAFRKGLKVLPFDDVNNITDDVTNHVVKDLHKGNFSRRRFNIVSKQFVMRDKIVNKYTHPNTTMVVSVGDPVEHFSHNATKFCFQKSKH